jgi:hypothetical protein
MNRTPSSHPCPPVGEKVPGGRMRGICNASWHRFASKGWKCSVPMYRIDSSTEISRGRAGFSVYQSRTMKTRPIKNASNLTLLFLTLLAFLPAVPSASGAESKGPTSSSAPKAFVEKMEYRFDFDWQGGPLIVLASGLEGVLQGRSPIFSASDLIDLPSLAAKLHQPSDKVSQYLRGRFSDATLQTLADYRGPSFDPKPLLTALVQELNKIVQGELIYEEQRFAGVNLSTETRKLLEPRIAGERLQAKYGIPLNRLLLVEAYPQELSKKPQETLNVLIPQDLSLALFPAFRLKNVTMDELFEGLNLIRTPENPIHFQASGTPEHRIQVAQGARPRAASVAYDARVFFVGDILQKSKIEDVKTAIETGWQMVLHNSRHSLTEIYPAPVGPAGRYPAPPSIGGPSGGGRASGAAGDMKLKFHKETQLLIVSASPKELDIVKNVLDELRKGLQIASESPAPVAKPEKQE